MDDFSNLYSFKCMTRVGHIRDVLKFVCVIGTKHFLRAGYILTFGFFENLVMFWACKTLNS